MNGVRSAGDVWIDPRILERVAISARSPYRKLDLPAAAHAIHDLLVARLRLPLKLRVAEINRYPWVEVSHRQPSSRFPLFLATVTNAPLAALRATECSGVTVTLAPRFLRTGEGGRQALIDHLLHRSEETRTEFDRAFLSPGRSRARAALKTKGAIYDLDEIVGRIREAYFRGDPSCERAKHRWANRCSRQVLGRYYRSKDLITINPALDDAMVPRVVVEHVVFHELLHAHLMELRDRQRAANPEGPRTRWRHHDAAFRLAEAAFPGHAEAMEWIQKQWRGFAKEKQRKTREARSKSR